MTDDPRFFVTFKGWGHHGTLGWTGMVVFIVGSCLCRARFWKRRKPILITLPAKPAEAP